MSTQQQVLDYRNNAQHRTCVEGKLLVKAHRISVTAGTSGYDLPSNVVQLTAVNVGDTPLPSILVDQAFCQETAGISPVSSFYLLGRTLVITPEPAEDTTLTILFRARPEELTSALEFEVSGDAETVIEQRVLADTLADDRQDDLADMYEQLYADGITRLRRAQRGVESPRVMPTNQDAFE